MAIKLPKEAVELLTKPSLPEASCVYFLMHQGQCVYVGQTTNLRVRIADHYREAAKEFDGIFFLSVPNDLRLSSEREWIAKLNPKYNGTVGRPRNARPNTNTFTGIVSSNVIRLREKIGLTVEAAADKSGISKAAWYRIERGDMPRTTAIHFIDLAEFFGCKLYELVKRPVGLVKQPKA